jgi:DNA polymerase III sliding clamp (beta) subunit (PCNA family)
MATEKIYIQIDDNKIELTGADKEAFLEQRAKDQAEQAILESEAQAKKQARIDAITKLGQASGLTTEEIESILNI